MSEIRIADDLWATSMAPEGMLEAWRLPDGAYVNAGQAVAEVRLEDCLHELLAPRSGHLSQLISEGSVIDPGCLIGEVWEEETA